VSTSAAGDVWELELPDLMVAEFWAQGMDAKGRIVKSMNLGNVGCDLGR